MTQQLAITGVTVIDGTGNAPVRDGVVLVADGRITAVGHTREIPVPDGAVKIDARGKYAIPGLIDSVNSTWFKPNVENMIRYDGRYHELFLEASQIALKNGVTGMFATWIAQSGARKASDMIKAGEAPGCRIYVGGNIIGFDGMFSPDLYPDAAAYLSESFVKRTNDEWEKGTGRALMWMSADEVRAVMRKYLETEKLDYVKYAANGHFLQGNHPNAQFLSFSERVQKVMIEESHRVGLSIQAHTMSVEGTDTAIEVGVDILTHGDMSGPGTPFPAETIQKMVERGTAVGVLPLTQRNLEARRKNVPGYFTEFLTVAKENRLKMIEAGVQLHVGTECALMSKEEAEAASDLEDHSVEPSLHWQTGEAHFNALLALEEEGMDSKEILKTATSNAAKAYKLANVGTLEPGKYADILLLDSDPLESARNYRSISTVIKDGRVVDRQALPVAPIKSVRS